MMAYLRWGWIMWRRRLWLRASYWEQEIFRWYYIETLLSDERLLVRFSKLGNLTERILTRHFSFMILSYPCLFGILCHESWSPENKFLAKKTLLTPFWSVRVNKWWRSFSRIVPKGYKFWAAGVKHGGADVIMRKDPRRSGHLLLCWQSSECCWDFRAN